MMNTCGKVLVDLRGKVHRDWKTNMPNALFLPMTAIDFSIHRPVAVRLSSGKDTRATKVRKATNDNAHQNFGGSAGLEKIFSMARAGGGVFCRGLHFAQISRRRADDLWLRVCACPADRPAKRPARVLFWAGGGISLLRAATVF